NPLASNTLGATSSSDSGTLTMSQNGLFHFILGADNGSTSSSAVITLTVYDSKGRVVCSFDTVTGQPPTTAVAYLTAGTYRVHMSVKSSSGSYLPIKYLLSGEVLSDPIGPYQSDPTSSSSPPPGDGYTYSGSPSSSSPCGTPTYY